MIYYGCPKCGNAMASPDSMRGQAETCAECGNVTNVPNAAIAPAAVEPAAVLMPYAPQQQQQPNLQVIMQQSPPPRATAMRAAILDDRIVLSVRPAMFRNRPILFVALLILFPLGIIALPLWWLGCLCTRLTVTESRTVLRTGILSKATNEVRHCDVRNIRVTQGILQRVFNVGAIGISSAGQADIEVIAWGIPRVRAIAEMIRLRQG